MIVNYIILAILHIGAGHYIYSLPNVGNDFDKPWEIMLFVIVWPVAIFLAVALAAIALPSRLIEAHKKSKK